MSQSKLSVEMEHEDKIALNWTIPSFKGLYDTSKADKTEYIFQEEFTIGGKNWAFFLKRNNEDVLGTGLSFLGHDCASAEYTVQLQSPGGRLSDPLKNWNDVKVEQNLGNDALKFNIDGNTWVGKWGTLSQCQNQGFLKDDTLHLTFIVGVYSRNGMKMKASTDLKNGLGSGLGSDMKFVFVEEEGSENVIGEIKAHKAILPLRSPVFATMFASGMKEATDGVVEISDISPKAFKILLRYIYSGEVDGEWGSVAEELFYGADKYDLTEIKNYLCANVEPMLTVENVMKIRNVATLYNLPQVLESTAKFIEKNVRGFLDNHEVIFKNTSETSD